MDLIRQWVTNLHARAYPAPQANFARVLSFLRIAPQAIFVFLQQIVIDLLENIKLVMRFIRAHLVIIVKKVLYNP